MNETNENTTDTNSSEHRNIVEHFHIYYIPILVLLGTIGNALSIIVFFSTKLRKLSSSIYLAALAVTDTGYLLCQMVLWMEMMGYVTINGEMGCRVIGYVVYVCCFLSAWLVVAFTVERFVAVLYPLQRPFLCTAARAKLVLLVMTCFAFIGFLPLPLAMTSEPKPNTNNTEVVCKMDSEWEVLAEVYNLADTIFTFVLPFLVIATLNTCIAATVWRLAWVRRSMTITVRRDAFSTNQQSQNERRNNLRTSSSQIKVTKMLLVVSTVFLILNLPAYVLRIFIYTVEMTEMDDDQRQRFISLQHFFNLLYHTNFGINFVLYCVSGQNFRRSLTSLICPRALRHTDSTQATTVVSEFLRSSGSVVHRRTVSHNGMQTSGAGSSRRDVHELLPLTHHRPSSRSVRYQ